MQNRSRQSLVLYLCMLVMGSCGLAYEYTLSKVAADLLGNSTRQWALVIGFMMFFMGLGASLQQRLRKRRLFDSFVILENLLGLLGSFAPLILFYSYGWWYSHYVLVQYSLIAGLGLLIGLEIPIVTRINHGFNPKLRVNLGRILQMDYIGALGGAVIWSFLLLPYVSLSRSAFILGFSNQAITWIFQLYFYRKLKHPRLLLLSSSLVSALLIIGYIYSPLWNIRAEQALYRDPIVLSHSSPYQHIVLTKGAPRPALYASFQGSATRKEPEYRMYINGHIQFSSRDEYIYHENLVHPAFALARQKKRVLILGGGDGLALREVLKYPELEEVVLCDLDPDILRLAQDNPILRQLNHSSLWSAQVRLEIIQDNWIRGQSQPELLPKYHSSAKFFGSSKDGGPSLSPNVQIVALDAMEYMKHVQGLFDVIIADFPDPNNENLSKLYSLPFYHLLKQHLSDGGVIVQQASSALYASKAFLTIGRTMIAAGLDVLPYQDFIPSFGPWAWWLARNSNSEEAQGRSKRSLVEDSRSAQLAAVPLRYLNREIYLRNFSFPAEFAAELQKKPQEIENYYQLWVNTLTEPKIYQYYLEAAW